MKYLLIRILILSKIIFIPVISFSNQLIFYTKTTWGGAEVKKIYLTHRPDKITIHHDEVLLKSNKYESARILRHERYHRKKGWREIAYHFIIGRSGKIYLGRNVTNAGRTATEYKPKDHILICLLGNFRIQKPKKAQIRSLNRLVSYLRYQYKILPDKIKGHAHYSKMTDCPGKYLHPYIKSREFFRKSKPENYQIMIINN